MKTTLLLALPSAAATRRAWAAVGDSITNGHTFSATTMPEALEASLGVPVDNFGIGFDIVSRAYSRWQTYVKPFQYKGVIIEIGTNDLAAGTSGATVWSAIETWIEEAQAAGQRVVICTIFPRNGSSSWDAGKEAERQVVNAAIRAKVAADPTLILFDGDEELSDDGETLRASVDFGDALHLNEAGLTAWAAYLAGVL